MQVHREGFENIARHPTPNLLLLSYGKKLNGIFQTVTNRFVSQVFPWYFVLLSVNEGQTKGIRKSPVGVLINKVITNAKFVIDCIYKKHYGWILTLLLLPVTFFYAR